MPLNRSDRSDGEARREVNSRRKTIQRARQTAVSEFVQGRRNLCGWFGWRQGVFLIFALLIGLGLTLYFVLPRVPSLAYDTTKPLDSDGGDANFIHMPGNFSYVQLARRTAMSTVTTPHTGSADA